MQGASGGLVTLSSCNDKVLIQFVPPQSNIIWTYEEFNFMLIDVNCDVTHYMYTIKASVAQLSADLQMECLSSCLLTSLSLRQIQLHAVHTHCEL